MDNYAHEGQSISGRFDLIYPLEHQLPYEGASSWVARDTVLSRQLRAIVLDPDGKQKNKVLDSARRTALIDNPDLVSILSVVSDDTASAVLTEIPPGQPLDEFLTGEPMDPTAVRSIMGQVSSTVNSVRHRGVRHLQVRAGTIFVQDSGGVIVDGFGTHAALAGADTQRNSSELDRDEARGLAVLFASLLLGRDFPEDPAQHDAVIREASELPDLPDAVRDVLEQEKNGNGAQSPGEFMRRLAPWTELDSRLLGAPVAGEDPDATQTYIPSVRADDFGTDDAGGSPSDRGSAESGVSATAVDVADRDGDVVDGADGNDSDFGSFFAAGGALTAAVTAGAVAGTASGKLGTDEPSEGGDETSAPEPARSPEDAARRVDRALGLTSDHKLSSRLKWPSLKKSAGEAAESPVKAAGAGAAGGAVAGAVAAGASSAKATPSAPGPRRTSALTQESSKGAPPASSEAGSTQKMPAASDEGRPQRTTPASAPRSIPPASRPTTRPAGQVPASTAPARNTTGTKVILIVFAVLVFIAGIWSINRVFQPPTPVEIESEGGYVPMTTEAPQEDEATDGEAATQEEETADEVTAEPVIADIQLVNPDAGLIRGTDPASQDNPGSVGNAIDGNEGTHWATWTYTDPLMRPMDGVGLLVQLEEPARVSEVVVNVNGEGGNIQWRDTVVEAPASGKLVSESAMSGETTLSAEEPIETDQIILWITEQPTATADGAYRTEVTEITVK